MFMAVNVMHELYLSRNHPKGGEYRIPKELVHEAILVSCLVSQELILFSRADLERSIPSMVDGLKPGQRKILFACFKKNLKTDIKACRLPR